MSKLFLPLCTFRRMCQTAVHSQSLHRLGDADLNLEQCIRGVIEPFISSPERFTMRHEARAVLMIGAALPGLHLVLTTPPVVVLYFSGIMEFSTSLNTSHRPSEAGPTCSP
jgi:hypothetical protein